MLVKNETLISECALIPGARLQPIISAHSGDLFGYEILSNRPDSLDMEEYFKNAPRQLTRNILDMQLSFARHTDHAFYYFINIPVRELTSPSLKTEDAGDSKIIIEIQDPRSLLTLSPYEICTLEKNVRVLQQSGYRVWIDDMEDDLFPVIDSLKVDIDGIKVDKFLFWSMLENISGLENFLCRLRQYSSKLLIEGIETERYRAIAESCGATYMQGYLWSEKILNNIAVPT